MSTLQLPPRLTGSWLAAVGAGCAIHKGLVDTPAGSWCCYCGHAFAPGELAHVDTNIGSNTFNDTSSMAGNGGGLMCDACAALLSDGKSFIQTYQKGYATLHGIWPLRSNTDIAHFIFHTPEPPFVAVCGTAKQTHVYWRTPVAHSQDVFPVRVGNSVGMIRRDLVIQVYRSAFDICEQAMAYDAEQRQLAKEKARSTTKKAFRSHPFVRLDRDMSDPAHGAIKPVVQRFLASKPNEAPYSLLAEVNSHEAWALAALLNLKEGADIHTRPEPLATATEDTTVVY